MIGWFLAGLFGLVVLGLAVLVTLDWREDEDGEEDAIAERRKPGAQ